MENKKVRNATPTEYNGIKFRSRLEVMIYKTLIENGITPQYEETTLDLLPATEPAENVRFYVPYKKELKATGKVRDITYTPDFTFFYKNNWVIIEAKGFANDTFPVKRKLILKVLNELVELPPYTPILFFEIHTKKQLLEAIEIIKNYEPADK